MSVTYEYPRANITTDIVYVHPQKGILLIKRKNFPGAGKWATPGGHLEMEERLEDCAKREFLEECGFAPKGKFDLVGVFDDIERDPRGRYITFAYLVLWTFGDKDPIAGDDALECQFFDPNDIDALDMAIDFKEIVSNVLFNSYKNSNALR